MSRNYGGLYGDFRKFLPELIDFSGSKVIVAINKDQEANIFNVAHFGIVGDYKEVLPALTAKLKELKSAVGDILFRRIDPFFGQLPPPEVKELTALGAGSAGAENRLWNIDRTLEGSAHKDPGYVGLHRIDRIGFAESVRIELDAELICQSLRIRRRVQSNG